MRGSLRFILLLSLLADAPQAAAQFMYLDSDGDGVYTVNETLNPATTAVDVWLDTSHNRDGSAAACNSSSAALTVGSYSFALIHVGFLTFGTWQDSLGFVLDPTDLVSENRLYVYRGSDVRLPAGRYKLGTLNLSGVGTGSFLGIVAGAPAPPEASTAFGTDCEGLGGDHLYLLGRDWMDVGGVPYLTDATTSTSWGSIKARYR